MWDSTMAWNNWGSDVSPAAKKDQSKASARRLSSKYNVLASINTAQAMASLRTNRSGFDTNQRSFRIFCCFDGIISNYNPALTIFAWGG